MRIQALLLAAALSFQCGNKPAASVFPEGNVPFENQKPAARTGADQLELLLPLLKGKNVALVVNHTSLSGKAHLADTLQANGVIIKKVFAPEHGFRGAAADGEKISDGIDSKTGLSVVSLYGSNRKPTPEQLADVEVVIFDIQDVGTRFYTYISTMGLVMEACGEQHKKMIILDRPNPNGSYVDGPMLDPELKSFVGMYPIPIVHGLTVGELALMINGEGWLEKAVKCDLEIIKLKNWAHQDAYAPPVRPSPNLPNHQAVKLYPSLCLFEGTVISVGRGTQTPFLMIGNPLLKELTFQFKPVAIPGMSNTPPLKDQMCYGLDLSAERVEDRINLKYLLDFYNRYPDKEKFFGASFDRLAGTKVLKQQIKDGLSEDAIRKTWEKDLEAFKEKRKKYLLYP